MGSSPLYCEAWGETVQEAFKTAHKIALLKLQLESLEDCGLEFEYQGYTGTILGKEEFVEIELPEGKDPKQYAQDLALDPRVSDKWGPAGAICIQKRTAFQNGRWAFFGWASS